MNMRDRLVKHVQELNRLIKESPFPRIEMGGYVHQHWDDIEWALIKVRQLMDKKEVDRRKK